MNIPLLEIENLHVHFRIYGGTLKVLNGVDFSVEKGEKVGLVGETGCGKTTTMKAIMRILTNNSFIPEVTPKSKIVFNDKNMLKMNLREVQRIRRKNISMIFQDPTASLNPVFKVGEQLMDVIKYSEREEVGASLSRKEIKEIALQTLKEVALPDADRIMKNYPIQLSGGMRQRISIGMALVSAKDLLIADEPGTSLDVTIKDQILRLLQNLVKERKTSIILISHALGAVKNLVDRVYVMYAGTMVEVAKTEDFFTEPLHPYAKSLLKAIPKLSGGGIPEGIRGRIVNYLNPPKGCRFNPRCESAMPICRKEKPPFFHLGDDHEVSCFLYER